MTGSRDGLLGQLLAGRLQNRFHLLPIIASRGDMLVWHVGILSRSPLA